MCRLIITALIFALAVQSPISLATSRSQTTPLQLDDQTQVRDLIEHGQFDSAENLIRQDLDAGHDPFPSYLLLGYLELARKRVFASIRAYRQAEKLQPHNGEVHRRLAVNYFLLNQKALFQTEIQEALHDNPKDEQAYYLAGRFAYEVDKRFDLAIDDFFKAVVLEDRDYKAHYYLGLSYKALNRAMDAQQEFERACELVTSLGTQYDLPFRSLAEVFSESLNQEKAWEYAEKAIAVDPRDAENYYLRGKVELAMGKVNNAIQSLERAASLDHTYAQPYYLLGKIYNATGQRDLAQQAYARFQSLQKEYDGK